MAQQTFYVEAFIANQYKDNSPEKIHEIPVSAETLPYSFTIGKNAYTFTIE
ncbi:hypothetical protein [Paenibacillus dakarensis]|uniref:hypothetical protein n=1 Tax=Paenibacillus dakarensis TaxID=1527293 RepID=UPI000AFC339D|nr:hypothetical protein [Paenibacillus dakarensis]